MAIDPTGFFVGVQDHCLRLDPATGKTLGTYKLPPKDESDAQLVGKRERWGYLAYVDGLLYGTRSYDRRTTGDLFALDPKTGKPVWRYRGREIPQSTLCIGGGTVFLLDKNVDEAQKKAYLDERAAEIDALPEELQEAARDHLKQADVRKVVALDAKTGTFLWSRTVDVCHTGGGPDKYNGSIATMYNNDVLVLFGIYLDGHFWKQFFAGTFDHRAVTAFDANSGDVLWSKPVGFRVRPLIIGDTLHAEPWAFDLRTGEDKTRIHPITGEVDRWQFARPGHHCGCPAASPNCLFFRSWYLGYYDLLRDNGTYHFAAHRPGCWISFIPAAGLLLAPEADTGCLCTFPNACTVVYEPAKDIKTWSMFSAPGSMTPVKRLGLNLGVTGDRKDEDGNWWLGYPRPRGPLVFQFDVAPSFYPGGRFVQENSVYTDIEGDSRPWLFASAAEGLREFKVPLVGKGERHGPAIRLSSDSANRFMPSPAGGRSVLRFKANRSRPISTLRPTDAKAGAAVWKTFSGIEVDGALSVKFVATNGSPAADQMPLVNAVEIIREEVLELGCLVDDVEMSDREPEQTAAVTLKNLRKEPFEGTLVVEPPDGFQVKRPNVPVKLASGESLEHAIALSVAKGVDAKTYSMPVKLVDKNGRTVLERSASIDHLGRLVRLVLKPVADAHVVKRYLTRNQGTVGTLLIDGGDRKIEDGSHAQAFFRYANGNRLWGKSTALPCESPTITTRPATAESSDSSPGPGAKPS